MTASPDGVPEGACSQVFTERYGEFIFSNDRVTAFGPVWYALRRSQQRLATRMGESLLAGVFTGAVVVAALIKNLGAD
jgi:hypothetical protein